MPKTELACGTCYDLHDFGGSRKGIENGGQKESKNDTQIELLARGAAMGGFWRGPIFHERQMTPEAIKTQPKFRETEPRGPGPGRGGGAWGTCAPVLRLA